MADTSLSDFLRQQKAHQQKTSINVDAVRAEWIDAVQSLFEVVRTWLRPEQADGLLELGLREVLVAEERLGSYQMHALDIKAAGKVVMLEPVARIIIGGLGRVDMICGPKRKLLVRDARKKWSISSREPRDKGQPLDEHTFSEALKLMLG